MQKHSVIDSLEEILQSIEIRRGAIDLQLRALDQQIETLRKVIDAIKKGDDPLDIEQIRYVPAPFQAGNQLKERYPQFFEK